MTGKMHYNKREVTRKRSTISRRGVHSKPYKKDKGGFIVARMNKSGCGGGDPLIATIARDRDARRDIPITLAHVNFVAGATKEKEN